MNCFVHDGAHAVGICRASGKGLCRECAAGVGQGLAGRGRCEEAVRRITRADGCHRRMDSHIA